jgi:hypothetical protein
VCPELVYLKKYNCLLTVRTFPEHAARKLIIKIVLIVPNSVQFECDTRSLMQPNRIHQLRNYEDRHSKKIYSHEPPAEEPTTPN